MTLILSNADVEKLLTMPECIEALEESYVELAEGRGVNRTRSDCITPTSNPNAIYRLKAMDGIGIGGRRDAIRARPVHAAPLGQLDVGFLKRLDALGHGQELLDIRI